MEILAPFRGRFKRIASHLIAALYCSRKVANLSMDDDEIVTHQLAAMILSMADAGKSATLTTIYLMTPVRRFEALRPIVRDAIEEFRADDYFPVTSL